jgi:hypothetical protein
MFRADSIRLNRYLLPASQHTAPRREIRSPTWTDNPQRLVKYKKLYFTMGLDQQALRRTALLNAETQRTRYSIAVEDVDKGDPTGFKRARRKQLVQWRLRMNYQEYHLQHLFTRHIWGLLRKYPSGGAKIAGVADKGYFSYDFWKTDHRFTGEPLPASAKELYPKRRL